MGDDNTRFKIIRTALLSGAAAAALALFSGCGAEAETPPEPVVRLVKAMEVKPSHSTEVRAFPGAAQAAHETDLAFRVGGPLISLDVKTGQNVARGEVIARLDPRDFELTILKLEAGLAEARANLKAMLSGARDENIEQLKAGLAAAEAQLEEAESNYLRHKSLYEQKAIAKAAYDSAKAAHDTARPRVLSARKDLEIGLKGARKEDVDAMEARIQLMEVDLKSAKNALADTVLHAPADGAVNRKYVENFQHVRPGQSIVSLLDLSRIEVRTAIPQTLIARVSPGSGFTCTFDALPGFSVPARFKEIGKSTEGRGMSYPLTVTLEPPNGLQILPGMAAAVLLSVEESAGGPSEFNLPVSALFADPQGRTCIWKINPQTMTIKRTRVQAGDIHGEQVEIQSGAAAGDLVVTAGVRFLLEGQKVRLTNPGKGAEH